jgi:hypothetical protein
MACCCGSGRGQQDHSSRVRRYYQRREEAAEQQGTAAAAAAGCSSSSRVQQQQACVVGREGDELTDDEDDVFHTPPSSPRAANHGDRWRGGAAACAPSRSQEEDALLPALKKALLHNSFGGRALREMATVYGGEEWLLLRYLRAAGGRRHPPEVQVRKARELYERTVLWRAEHVVGFQPVHSCDCGAVLATSQRLLAVSPTAPQLHNRFGQAAAVPPTHRHLGDAGSTVEPSASELNVAARALLAHELKKWSPFRVEALVEAGVVLLSGNVDLVDVAPLRHAGFSKNRQFFVLVMEYVQLLQRGITAQLGRQHTTGTGSLHLVAFEWRAITILMFSSQDRHTAALETSSSWI